MTIEDIWFGGSVIAILFRILLLPFSLLYWLGWQWYLLIYRLGLKFAYKPHTPIVVVGNFTVGGTGKTPAVVCIARVLRELGYEVVIGCSGYGSPHQHNANLAPNGPLHAREWGDEPATLRELLPDVALIVGRERVIAAAICHSNFPNAVFLMDDGLQHLRLATDIQIVLEPAERGNRYVLPSGPYREPRDPNRASLILPGEFELQRGFERIANPTSGALLDIGSQVAVLTAIARPTRFINALRQQGFGVGQTVVRPDHDPLTEGKLFDSFEPDVPIVVTLKDWVKLRARVETGSQNIYVAYESVTIEPADRFKAWLGEKMAQAMAKEASQ